MWGQTEKYKNLNLEKTRNYQLVNEKPIFNARHPSEERNLTGIYHVKGKKETLKPECPNKVNR